MGYVQHTKRILKAETHITSVSTMLTNSGVSMLQFSLRMNCNTPGKTFLLEVPLHVSPNPLLPPSLTLQFFFESNFVLNQFSREDSVLNHFSWEDSVLNQFSREDSSIALWLCDTDDTG